MEEIHNIIRQYAGSAYTKQVLEDVVCFGTKTGEEGAPLLCVCTVFDAKRLFARSGTEDTSELLYESL